MNVITVAGECHSPATVITFITSCRHSHSLVHKTTTCSNVHITLLSLLELVISPTITLSNACYISTYTSYPPFASIAKGEVFVLLYVCLFVCSSTISRQPAGRFTPKFACRRTLVLDVSSPLLGVGGPRRTEKGANEIFVTMGVNGEFLHFSGF